MKLDLSFFKDKYDDLPGGKPPVIMDIVLCVVVVGLLCGAGLVAYQRMEQAIGMGADNLLAGSSGEDVRPLNATELNMTMDVNPPITGGTDVVIVDADWGRPWYRNGETVNGTVTVRNVGDTVIHNANATVVFEEMTIGPGEPSVTWTPIGACDYHYENLDMAKYTDYTQTYNVTIPTAYQGHTLDGVYRINVSWYTNGHTEPAGYAYKELNIIP